jgi:hypothetical protein
MSTVTNDHAQAQGSGQLGWTREGTALLRNSGLGLAFFGLAIGAIGGHAWAGLLAENERRVVDGVGLLDPSEYLASGAFLSSLFENWESAFLLLTLLVVVMVALRQRGSSESRSNAAEGMRSPPIAQTTGTVNRGSVGFRPYERSLSFALFGMFLASFVGHLYASYRHYVQGQRQVGEVLDHGLGGHLVSSQFWFESLQNWQGEFFSIAFLILLIVYLRTKDAAHLKEVAAPNWDKVDPSSSL